MSGFFYRGDNLPEAFQGLTPDVLFFWKDTDSAPYYIITFQTADDIDFAGVVSLVSRLTTLIMHLMASELQF